MVVVSGKKFACATCIKGHRSSSCNHTERPLFAIRAKGRPVSQCEHCRELRKTKQVHVKCECDTKPLASAIPDTEGQPVVARKGARKVKTLENQKPVFPNGIVDMEEAQRYLMQLEANDMSSHDSNCACKDGGSCNCCTDRYVPKHARGDSSGAGPSSSRPTHGSRPSISLTIPHPDDGPSSPSQATTPTHGRRGSRSHSRSPSRAQLHNTSEGHVIGGSPNDHRQHPMHYSPYPTSAVNGPFNQSPSSAAAASMSPSHLAPPGMDSLFAYNPDSSAPTSPLSVDYDRPGSAISVHSGRNTPFDYSNLPATPTHPQTGSSLFGSSDLTTIDAMRGMSLAAGNTSPSSATVGPGTTMDQILSSPMNQRLSPFGSYRQTQQEMPSPISPTTPQFLSPTESSAQTSPTSYAPLAQTFNGNMSSVDPFGVTPTSQLEMQLMGANFGGPNQQYTDVFDGGDLDQNDGGLLFGDRSRRGSHQSIASSHSGHGNFLQANSSNRFPPGSAPMSATASPNIGVTSELGDLSNGLAMLGQPDGTSNPTCSSSTKGCTCLNLDGSLKALGERCSLVDCPCCSQRNYDAIAMSSLFGGNGATSNSGFALSTERDGGPLDGVGTGVNGNVSSFGIGYTQSLQLPLQVGRSRSSSQSSQISNISTTSFSSLTNGMSGIDISIGGTGGASGLGRANSTGQIGRGNKYKNIAPKPAHHNTEPVTSRANQLQGVQSGTAGLASSQQSFSFPRAPGGGLAQSSPALIVTQPQPSDGDVLDLLRSALDGSSTSGQGLFGGGTNNSNNPFGNGGLSQAQSFNPKPMFDFSNPGVISTSDSRHMRNFSHPTNLQTMVTSVSGPPSPHPRSPVHFSDAGGTGSGPASPLLRNPSSPSPNSPHLTQPSSPSINQSPPIITISHGRSQSSSNVGLLEQPRPMHYSHHTGGHGRSASTSFLDPLGRSGSFPSVIVTPASPHPGSSGSTSGQQH